MLAAIVEGVEESGATLLEPLLVEPDDALQFVQLRFQCLFPGAELVDPGVQLLDVARRRSATVGSPRWVTAGLKAPALVSRSKLIVVSAIMCPICGCGRRHC